MGPHQGGAPTAITLADLLNSLFELGAAGAVLLNIGALRRDRRVRGLSWVALVFFTAWGLWNLYHYPHLGRWLSFAGGILLTAANVVYLAMVLHFIREETDDGHHVVPG